MKILVDADACPVVEICIEIAKKNQLEIYLFFDTNHLYTSDYAQIVTVDQGRDSVDYKLIAFLEEKDIVITQDYGLACLALSKKAKVLNQNGLIYTSENIDSLLISRYLSQKERNSHKHLHGPKKRTKENDVTFKNHLNKLLDQ